MKAYDQDLRQKIIEAFRNREGSYRKLAKRFHVSLSFIQTLLWRYLDTGSIEPLPHKSGNLPKIKEEYYPILQKLVEENNDATLKELCVQIELQTQIKISLSGMSKTLHKLKLTRKKNLTRSRARHG
ncbi:transposase [Tolypothrix sp. NIES-4075]|uniref:helix-turn-helix domain-containing protein n=1 Tax=Tolypothrix sp. NIES-4075 TaxID=2005459 RepID=UPI000B5C3B1C|nr:IS630 transposase-related protein [Tolypothrix sp. NIES-4075]GAX46369.1 transposase [Tolypothrix sp. NIES-4075]